MCKNPRSRELEGRVAIYRWAVDERRLVPGARAVIPESDFAERLEGKRFQPSGIERHPVSGNYFIVAARQRAVAEVSPDGRVLAVERLRARRHRQAEGITFAGDGALLLADEGAGRRARLTVYPMSDPRP